MHAYRLALLMSCCLLAACGGDKAGTDGAQGEDGLPKPAAAGGSVTGMPNPGVAEARPAASAAQQPDIVEFPEPVDAGDVAPADPAEAPAAIGNPVSLPESTMPVDPNAPPAPPAEATEVRVQDDKQK
jgi:hypothetical protein